MTELTLDFDLWPRQMAAYTSPAREILYGGAMESGKSHFTRVCLSTWCLAIAGLQCVLIRKKFADIQANHVEGPTGFRQMLRPLIEAGKAKITKEEITFSNGSRIQFQHCQDERQFDSAQGVEKHVLAIDEATQISERLIRFFRTWVRMPLEMKNRLPDEWKGKFPRIIYTANPIGPSVPFFKRRFVDLLPNDTIKEIDGFPRQYIPARYTDNLSVDQKDHEGRVQGIGDARLARALDIGDWNALTGEFFEEWDEDRHVVKQFTPPDWWTRMRAFDWGTRDPACCLWAALSDGEPFRDEEGNKRWFPRGAIIIYREWYICDDQHSDPAERRPEKGARMNNEDMARGIVERSDHYERNVITLSDSMPFVDNGGITIAQTFKKHGCTLTHGDTSRVPGWSQMRSRLSGVEIYVGDDTRVPMLFVTSDCKYLRDYIPALPRHPSEAKTEDAAEHGEATHACDALRLICMWQPMVKDKKEPLQSRIERELRLSKPTIKRLAPSFGR